MRSSLPVNHVEYVLQEGESPTSRTDIHGNITYVNQDFTRISGFSEDELIGQPQNIVRHPDIPVEAFADLWRTVKSGKPWTGLMKNCCKHGDHYWVEANVSPIIENQKIVGYTSVRAKPSREQVQADNLSQLVDSFRLTQTGRTRVPDRRAPTKSASSQARTMSAISGPVAAPKKSPVAGGRDR